MVFQCIPYPIINSCVISISIIFPSVKDTSNASNVWDDHPATSNDEDQEEIQSEEAKPVEAGDLNPDFDQVVGRGWKHQVIGELR